MKRPKKPPTMGQVLYQLDRGRLAAIRIQMDEIIMGQRSIVSELGVLNRRAQHDWTDCQAAMTDLLHRIVALEKKKQ